MEVPPDIKFFEEYEKEKKKSKIDVPSDKEFNKFDVLPPNSKRREIDYLKIVTMSDTHTNHNEFNLKTFPSGDLFLFCGDFMHKKEFKKRAKNAWKKTLHSFNEFIGQLNFKLKFVCCGNHDYLDRYYSRKEIQKKLSNCIYLEDKSHTFQMQEVFGKFKKWKKELNSITIHASPFTRAVNMGFCTKRLYRKWRKIPDSTNILMTHVPPFNILDLAYRPHDREESFRSKPCKDCGGRTHSKYSHWGSHSLFEKVDYLSRKKQLMLHCFGHVHDNFGVWVNKKSGMIYVNGAIPNSKVRKPQTIYFPLC